MSKVVKYFRVGDTVPEGAKFLGIEKEKVFSHYSYEDTFFRERTYANYKLAPVFVYEVEETDEVGNEPQT